MYFALSEQKYVHGFNYQSIVPCSAYTDQSSYENYMYDTDHTATTVFSICSNWTIHGPGIHVEVL